MMVGRRTSLRIGKLYLLLGTAMLACRSFSVAALVLRNTVRTTGRPMAHRSYPACGGEMRRVEDAFRCPRHNTAVEGEAGAVLGPDDVICCYIRAPTGACA